MSPILASQEFQNRVLGLREVLDECQAAATLPFLFEGDQFPAFSETDQNVNVFRHDDEAQAESAVLGTQFFEIVNDDPLATVLIQ